MTFSVVTSALPMMGSMAATNFSIFSSLSTISMIERQILRQAQDLGGVQMARMAEAHRPAQHGGAGKAHLARLQHDRLVEGLMPGLVVLADEDAQQHGVA